MAGLSEKLTRKGVLDFISESSCYGNLGLFIGAGFSKAVLNIDAKIALSWGELLEKAAEKMGVDFEKLEKVGVSYPDLASSICKTHSQREKCKYIESLASLKSEIAASTSWYPSQAARKQYGVYLDSILPAWIITTNYDQVIESLLTGRSTSLGPNDPLSSPKGVVPVFHLHGIRTNPSEIIISQEDYVALFRPNEYRQIKLALTIKESTTLLLGYGLGDVNVLTALDWSRNVFGGGDEDYPREVIQVVRQSAPKTEPYRDANGIIIIEAEEISKFFDDLLERHAKILKKKADHRNELEELTKKFSSPKSSMVAKFVDDKSFRDTALKVLSKNITSLAGGFESFLEKCLEETWQRSIPNGAFEAYAQNLAIVLDILTAFPVKKFPPALFQSAAYSFEKVGYYVGDGLGQSHAASNLWRRRKGGLDTELVAELKVIGKQYGYAQLHKLLKEI
jgi:hypothetical protein